jgi:putative ABC transport system permease protein
VVESLFRKRTGEVQLDSELRFHIEELVKANLTAGMEPGEARKQARLDFGGTEQVKEEMRDIYRIAVAEAMLANMRSAVSFMRKSPLFSVTVVLTLALGIGANSAVFSAIDAILLRPLPFPDGDQLMRLRQINPKIQGEGDAVAPVRLEDWNRMNSTFQSISGYYTEDASETSGGLPEKVTRAVVTPRFPPDVGSRPHWGGTSIVTKSGLAGRTPF